MQESHSQSKLLLNPPIIDQVVRINFSCFVILDDTENREGNLINTHLLFVFLL